MPEFIDDRDRPADETDLVAHLMRAAGRRIEPPAATYERVLAAATASWETKVRRRRWLRGSVAVAASIAIVSAVLVLLANPQRAPATLVGHVDRVVGAFEVRRDDGWTALSAAADLGAGERIRTHGDSRAGILLAGEISLRLADRTEVLLESSSRLRVLAGKIYVDTGASAARAHPRIEVVTAAGVAADYGTQFEVRYIEGAFRVRVREGQVGIDPADSASLRTVAGDDVIIRAGSVERLRIVAADEEWQWVESIAPKPAIDGRPLSFLLAWVARETGRQVRFDGPASSRKADTTILHGDIGTLAPLDALGVMLATTDLEHAILDDGTILIRLRGSQQR
ncbi:MAG TPA: FecR family protein [Steroidobacteraceae bacterium]|jgi:ferric-dicitrate binding protein FerR (iron transport regulator)|nr:FecR family protein [Steroidobacteraceae bacterium]